MFLTQLFLTDLLYWSVANLDDHFASKNNLTEMNSTLKTTLRYGGRSCECFVLYDYTLYHYSRGFITYNTLIVDSATGLIVEYLREDAERLTYILYDWAFHTEWVLPEPKEIDSFNLFLILGIVGVTIFGVIIYIKKKKHFIE